MSSTLGVHVSWTGKPGDKYVQFTDVSSYVTAVDTQRGRSTELDGIQTGTATVTLDNADGQFTPGRAYGGELLPDAVKQTAGTSGWVAGSHASLFSGAVTSPPTGYSYANALGMNITSSVTSGEKVASTPNIPVTPGKSYRAGYLVQNISNGVDLVCNLAFFDSTGTRITSGIDYDPGWRQYADVVAASLPIAHYRLADASLTTQANPSVGTDPMVCYNVTTAAAPTWDYNGSATSANFNGTSSIAEPCGLPLLPTNGLPSSIELWFSSTAHGVLLGAGPAGSQVVSNAGVPTAATVWPLLYIGADSALHYVTPNATAGIATNFSVNDGRWHHAVITTDGANTYYYCDGVNIGHDLLPGPVKPILGYGDFTTSGASGLPSKTSFNYLAAQIADFALYRHQLTDQTIADHYRHGSTGPRHVPFSSTAWNALQASAVAPYNAASARLEVVDLTSATATTLNVYGPSIREISPNYGRIRPRRRVRIFATTGGNLMPFGAVYGYWANSAYAYHPANADLVELGCWSPGTSGLTYAPGNGVQLGPTTVATGTAKIGSSLDLGAPPPWAVVPGGSYTFACSATLTAQSANHTGQTFGVSCSVYDLATGAQTSFSSTPASLSMGTQTPVSFPISIPSTYTQVDLRFTVTSTETLSTGSTYAWTVGVSNVQLYDSTQPAPSFTAGDGTMPVFHGFVDKWEATSVYGNVAEVVVSCSDHMRQLGEVTTAAAPQQVGFRPDWNCLGAWQIQPGTNDNWTTSGFVVSPNNLFKLSSGSNNTAVNGLTYDNPSGAVSGTTPQVAGVFLGAGNTGLQFRYSLSDYLLSFGKLPAKGSFEYWYQPRQSASGAYGMDAGDHLLCGYGPFVNFFVANTVTGNAASTGTHQWSCGWNRRATFATPVTNGSSTDGALGGHIAVECVTTGGTSPTVSVTVYYNGTQVAQSTGETFAAASDPSGSGAYNFVVSGNRSLFDPSNSVNLGPMIGDVFAPAFYGATGLDWRSRLQNFDSPILGKYQIWGGIGLTFAAQTEIANTVASCGFPILPVVGQPANSPYTYVDALGFGGNSGLDAINTIGQQTGGPVLFSRYGSIVLQDRSWRLTTATPVTFDATGATAPNDSLLFLSDIDRTWTSFVYQQSLSQPVTVPVFPAYREYSAHQTTAYSSNGQLTPFVGAMTKFANYLTPTARCDSAVFTVINNGLASTALVADVGSRVVFTNLPATCPADSYYAWVESVKVSAKADGGTLVPEVTFSLSPDYTFVPVL